MNIYTNFLKALCCAVLVVCCCCQSVYATSNCLSNITVTFSSDGTSVFVVSDKDLSNVVLTFCDESADFKFDGLSGLTGTFTLGKELSGVYVKSGCNLSGGGPGYGEFFSRDCGCDTVVDECGICGGSGKDECGTCDGSIVKDECGVCGGDGPGECGCNGQKDECGVCNGNGPGECGCDLSIVKDECGVCGGDGPGECGCNKNITKDDCGVCGGDGPGECGCDLNVKKDSCGVCGGTGPGECGCSGDVRDECGICAGTGPGECGCDFNIEKDLCGVCDGDNSCVDCFGVPFGTATVDDCGICDGDNTSKGCDGVCFSGKVVDECGVCGGDGTSCIPLCEEKVIKVKTKKVFRRAKILRDRAISFEDRAEACAHRKYGKYSKIATRLFAKFNRILKTITKTRLEICSGQCEVVKYKKSIAKLRRVAKRLFNIAQNSKHNAVVVCRVPKSNTPDNRKRGSDYYEDLLKAVKKLPKKKKVCLK